MVPPGVSTVVPSGTTGSPKSAMPRLSPPVGKLDHAPGDFHRWPSVGPDWGTDVPNVASLVGPGQNNSARPQDSGCWFR